ncbi:MAG: hypothetical protein IJS91_07365 [Bacteroidales bacterium]|nr:hypothetical protein [Bacteroidales bacterium]
MKRLLRLCTVLCLLAALPACNFVERIFHDAGDDAVARVGKDVLYRSDIRKLIPQGVPAEDSVRMVQQYINTWAKGKLLMLQAEANLSKEAKDVTGELAEFRQNLLTFRYEKLYIESRLDTLVTDAEAQEYYESHKASFTFSYSLVKARIIRISKKSPYYDMIKDNHQAETESDVADLEEMCYASAEKYVDFGKSWVPVATFAKELGMETAACEAEFARGRSFEREIDGQNHLVYLMGRIAPNQPSPFEYNAERIRELLLSKRKQELLASLEQELFEDAKVNGKLIIYDQDE